MANKLKEYFPLIREREELLAEIKGKRELYAVYEEWNSAQREEFLDFCTGVRGVKILYDSFFKEVMNPEYAPERLEEFLCAVLKRKVKILRVLPNDSTRISDEGSLLITDIVVELEDGAPVIRRTCSCASIGEYAPGRGMIFPIGILRMFI